MEGLSIAFATVLLRQNKEYMYYTVNCKAHHKFATCLLIFSRHLCKVLVAPLTNQKYKMQTRNQEHSQRLELRFSQNKKDVLVLLEIFKAYFNNLVVCFFLNIQMLALGNQVGKLYVWDLEVEDPHKAK